MQLCEVYQHFNFLKKTKLHVKLNLISLLLLQLSISKVAAIICDLRDFTKDGFEWQSVKIEITELVI